MVWPLQFGERCGAEVRGGLSRPGMLITAHPALVHKFFNEATGSSDLIALDYTTSPSVTLREALSEADTVELRGS